MFAGDGSLLHACFELSEKSFVASLTRQRRFLGALRRRLAGFQPPPARQSVGGTEWIFARVSGKIAKKKMTRPNLTRGQSFSKLVRAPETERVRRVALMKLSISMGLRRGR